MPRLPRACPECRSPLGSTRVQRNGKFRCPECGAVVAPEHEVDSDYALQSTPTSKGLAVVLPATKTPYPNGNKDQPALKKNRSLVGVICVVLGLGVLAFFGLLVVLGGSIGLWLLLRSSPSAVAVADSETAVAPVVQDVVNPNPPPVQVNPPPVKPLPPPKEPIKPVAQGAGPVPAVGDLPLEELKAASVYIKASTANMRATGSGFVIHAQGDIAYIVTNHHVVTPPTEQQPLGRPPRPPRAPFGRAAVADLTVVFRSGTPQEQGVKAVLVADDKEDDLAVLRVAGVQNTPATIDCSRSPKLRETMTVLAFGFPFGANLDPKKQDPAITVTKGAVSALRLDRGELSEVQLDLDLNPGNSGGPVVDEKGALIGVAVSKIVNSKIGFAVPVRKLHRLLEGRIDPTTLQTLSIQGQTQVRVLAHVADPMGKLRNPTLLYGSVDELKMPVQGKNGWDGLAGAKSSPLTIDGANAAAVLALVPPAKGDLKILVQVSVQNAAGQTVYGEPKTMSLGAPGAPPVVGPVDPGNAEKPPVVVNPNTPPTGDELTKLLADLKSPDEATRQRAANTLAKRPPKERLKEVQQSLQGLLSAPDPVTRTAAVKALAACDPKELSPALAKLLEDETPAVRHAVLRVIKDRKDAHFAEAVAARLPADTVAAAEALKAMGPAAEKAVLPYLKDQNSQARFWAFQVIKEVGATASVPALEEALQSKGTDAVHARGALQAVRERVPLTKEEWPQALDDLKSADATRRTSAVRRIAVTPPVEDRRADLLARLESLLNDQSGDVRTAAAKGLGRWCGKEAVPILVKRLEGFDPGGHAVVMQALAELKSDEAAAMAIAKRLPDAFDRGHATQALKVMDQAVAEKAVLSLFADTNVFVRVEACKVLVEIGGHDSIGPLEQLANENNVFYSGVATQALTAIKARVEGAEKK